MPPESQPAPWQRSGRASVVEFRIASRFSPTDVIYDTRPETPAEAARCFEWAQQDHPTAAHSIEARTVTPWAPVQGQKETPR
jgi:hypothetical protein